MSYNSKVKSIDDSIFIISMYGHHTSINPNAHFYSCTKKALMALTEGLRQELRAMNSHIRVTVSICYFFISMQCRIIVNLILWL